MGTSIPSFRSIESDISYANPIYPGYFADPFAFRHEGSYYAVGTSGPNEDSSSHVFQVLRSGNLVDWESVGYALEKLPGKEDWCYWAPEVAMQNGRFYMYYSVGEGDKHHRIRVAESKTPEGPYQDLGPITNPEIPFAIDPHVLQDGDDWYLFYATDLLSDDRPGTVLVVDRMLSPIQLAGEPQLVARATSDWQRYESNRQMYEGRYDWHTLEGPTVVKKDGRTYVFYSGGNWQNGSYGVDFVVADHPLGPYENLTEKRPRVLGTVPEQVIGPGHNSIVVGPDNETLIAVYHAWNPERTARLMRIDPILWTDDGPVIDGPSLSPRTL